MIFSVCDIETTGIDPQEHAVIEIACLDLIDGEIVNPRSSLVKPPHPIPPASSAVHHLIDADVAGATPAREAIPNILVPGRDGVVYVAHNAAFEKSFLDAYVPNVTWLCTYKAALRVWPDAESHSNQFLRYWLGLKFGDEAMPPHRALPDCFVTARILEEMLKSTSADEMIAWTSEPAMPFLFSQWHQNDVFDSDA